MPDKFFVDTDILIYAHDRTQGRKHDRAQQVVERLWDDGNGAISTQVLQELCVSLRRKLMRSVPTDEIRRIVRDYSSWEVVVNTADSVVEALDIQDRYRTSFWDALILQAAESCGATEIFSEDLAAGQKYGAIRVVNPLA